MAGKKLHHEHPFLLIILAMKHIPCAGCSTGSVRPFSYLPFSFHTRYHFSSLTVFWRLGFRQCCCSPLTFVHRVTLQRKYASYGHCRQPQPMALPAGHCPNCSGRLPRQWWGSRRVSCCVWWQPSELEECWSRSSAVINQCTSARCPQSQTKL